MSARTAESRLPFLLTYPGGATPTAASFGRRADVAAGSGPVALVLADLNYDGKSDVVAANALGNNVSLFRNVATTGSLTSASLSAKIDIATGTQPQGLAVADLDGDGKLDVITANAAANTVSVLRNAVTTAGAAFTTICWNPSSPGFQTRTGARPTGMRTASARATASAYSRRSSKSQ